MNDRHTPDFVVIDVETACARVSSICQVGIVGFRDGQEVFAWESLVDPLDTFDPFNTRIHGIAAHHVAGQPSFAQLHGVIERHLSGRITVAHSLFDKGALAAACRMHALPGIETRWLDSVRVSKRAWPELDNHRLGNLARFLKVEHRHHDALSDARAAGWVIVRAIEQSGISLAEWMLPPRPPGPAPKAAAYGRFHGERVAILGQPRDGALACALAAEGATIHSGVGLSTTMLVVAAEPPYSRKMLNSAAYTRAAKAIAAGRALRIVPAGMLGLDPTQGNLATVPGVDAA